MVGEESNVSFYWGSLSSLLNHARTSAVICAFWNGGKACPSVHSGHQYQYPPICSYMLQLTPVLHVCQTLLLGLYVRILPGSLPIDHVMLCNSPLPPQYPSLSQTHSHDFLGSGNPTLRERASLFFSLPQCPSCPPLVCLSWITLLLTFPWG